MRAYITDCFARLFSSRVRELEKMNDDLRAILGRDFDKVSVTRMSYDDRVGFEASFEGSLLPILASWAYNTLEACAAKNYVELGLVHPKGGYLTVTVQKLPGESPGRKVARLERELEEALAHGKSRSEQGGAPL